MDKLRTTFGIIDPKTNTKYSDIINAFIVHDTLEYNGMPENRMRYTFNGSVYFLYCDWKLTRQLAKEHTTKVIISIQERTDIYIALARIPNIEDIKEINYRLGDSNHATTEA